MIVYSKEAAKSYKERLEKLQQDLGSVPGNIINTTDIHWLIHTALNDLKKQIEREWPESEYEPTCPRGYTDCVGDPAYIQKYHPEWYKELYGYKTPAEVALESCVKRMEEDPDEKYSCYDDEDK